MGQEVFKEKVVSTIKQLINCISSGEYEKIPANVDIHKSWYSGDMTRAEALNQFKEWLDAQLKLLSEDYGKDFVIDAFSEECLDCDDLDLVEYSPRSNGERLDFWFEIFVYTGDDGEPLIKFNVNV